MGTLRKQVEHAAILMAKETDLDDGGIVDLLIQDGFSELLATRLNVFVPHAFGRILLQAKHAPQFRPSFLLERSDGLRVKIGFAREPIMAAASKLALEWMSTKENMFLHVANRSSEVDAAKQMSDWETGLMPLEFCEPVISGIDPCEYASQLQPHPWWKFWQA